MTDCKDKLISLLTCAMRGEPGQQILPDSISDDEIRELYELAKKHDLAHLIGVALETAEPRVKKRYKPFFEACVRSMYRYEWLKKEQERICDLLEQHHIRYIPLKGAVIRDLYHEPWHRTSSDIDILIPAESLETALAAFEKELSYPRGFKSRQPVTLEAPNGVHFELHFDGGGAYMDRDELWADAQPQPPGSYRHILSNEMLMMMHLAHMATHFVYGGCGIRPFLDLWLMNEKILFDREKLAQMLESHGLTKFSKVALGLVEVWFHGKEADKTELLMRDFVFSGGVYGNLNNRITFKRAAGKSKFAYILERLFLPYSSIKVAYPVLNRHPWLLPVCWVRRWVRLIFAGKLRQLKNEHNISRKLSADELNDTGDLLKQLELKK